MDPSFINEPCIYKQFTRWYPIQHCHKQTLLGAITAPLQALAMNCSVSISGMRPRESVGVAVPPTWTTQQLMLAPRMPLTVECIVVGLEKPEIPSVSMTRPFSALLGSNWMASVPALTIPSRLVSPGSWGA